MKFCMVTTFFGAESFGGDAAYVDRLSRALLRHGHEVHVVHCVDAFKAVRGNHPLRPYTPPDRSGRPRSPMSSVTLLAILGVARGGASVNASPWAAVRRVQGRTAQRAAGDAGLVRACVPVAGGAGHVGPVRPGQAPPPSPKTILKAIGCACRPAAAAERARRAVGGCIRG